MRLVFFRENDVLALLYFVKICGLYVRKRGVCGYGYIHGYPWKICGYGYKWEILYPQQAWLKDYGDYRYLAAVHKDTLQHQYDDTKQICQRV